MGVGLVILPSNFNSTKEAMLNTHLSLNPNLFYCFS